MSTVSDAALLRELHALAGFHRRVTAELIAHLGELDARRLHVDKGFSSLFSYCVEELRFSEDEACRRIDAARLARRFPAVVPLLETGALSLTVLALLKLHLTEDNHRELLAGVSGASVRRAKEWLAARFPLPDVPSSIRKLPAPLATAPTPTDSVEVPGAVLSAPTRVPSGAEPVDVPTKASGTTALLGAQPAPPARIEPLSADRFLVKLTVSRALRDKLELARDLMSHANPDGDLSVILERAVDLFIADLEKKRKGSATRPLQRQRPARDAHVTSRARREVVARDGWRCSFVADNGRRCDARAFLEFDHETPRGCGGDSRSDNLRLLCRAHNRLAAERVYGREHVDRAIAETAASARNCPSGLLENNRKALLSKGAFDTR